MASRIAKVTFLREIEEDEKLAPQARGIIESVVEAHGLNVAVTPEQISAAMEGNVTTRQPLERIFGYYAPKLETDGFISVERAEAAPKAKKEAAGADDSEGLDDELEDESEEA